MLTTAQGIFVYTADAQQVVQPTDVAVVGSSPRAVLTLTTCNPRYSAATRLVVTATLTSSLLFPAAAPKATSERAADGGRAASRAPGRAAATLPGTGLAGGTGEGAGRWAAAVGLGVAVVAVDGRGLAVRPAGPATVGRLRPRRGRGPRRPVLLLRRHHALAAGQPLMAPWQSDER